MTLLRVLPIFVALATAACTYDVKEVPLEKPEHHTAAVEGSPDADADADAPSADAGAE